MPKISENPRLLQSVHNYYDSSEKILPVVITGSSTSLTQAFIIALQRTLSDNGLLDIMPETNYRAAIAVIDRWKSEFPQTYKLFCNAIDKPVGVFLMNLQALIFLHTKHLSVFILLLRQAAHSIHFWDLMLLTYMRALLKA